MAWWALVATMGCLTYEWTLSKSSSDATPRRNGWTCYVSAAISAICAGGVTHTGMTLARMDRTALLPGASPIDWVLGLMTVTGDSFFPIMALSWTFIGTAGILVYVVSREHNVTQ